MSKALLEHKLIDAENYLELGDKHYEEKELKYALECYERAFVSYLEVYGDVHPKSVDVSRKVNEVLEEILKEQKN